MTVIIVPKKNSDIVMTKLALSLRSAHSLLTDLSTLVGNHWGSNHLPTPYPSNHCCSSNAYTTDKLHDKLHIEQFGCKTFGIINSVFKSKGMLFLLIQTRHSNLRGHQRLI